MWEEGRGDWAVLVQVDNPGSGLGKGYDIMVYCILFQLSYCDGLAVGQRSFISAGNLVTHCCH